MSDEWMVLEDVIGKMNDSGIDYLLSGSFAANFYKVPRVTRDIDLVVDLKNSDIDKFVKLFRDDYYFEKDIIKEEVNRLGAFTLTHKEYSVKVDFIIRKNTDFQTSMFLQKKKVQFESISLWMISLEDLILMKMLWAKDTLSEVQLRDAINLMKINLFADKDYISIWLKKLDIDRIF